MFFKIASILFAAILTTNAGIVKTSECAEKIQETNLTNIQKHKRIITEPPCQFRYLPAFNLNKSYFWVKTESDAIVSLSNAAQLITPKVVIVIGGWGNTMSAIRINDVEIVKTYTPQILSKDEYRGFWIKWSQEGYILVGKRNEDTPFLIHRHTQQFFPINFIGVTCFANYVGNWVLLTEEFNRNVVVGDNLGRLEKAQDTDLMAVQKYVYRIVTNTKPFRYIPAFNQDRMDFWVKAESDAHISLSNAPQYIEPKIIILIGGWKNTVSTIRINDVDETKTNTPEILSKDEYRGFWIKWSQEGDIAVGRRKETMPFLVYKHKQRLYPINFIGVTCMSDHITGHWNFIEDPVSDIVEL